MIDTRMRYDFKDLNIVPTVTLMNSRSDCQVVYPDGRLPLFTAPMDTVVSLENARRFQVGGINTMLPRTITNKWDNAVYFEGYQEYWAALSLQQFISLFLDKNFGLTRNLPVVKICIDIANGHMIKLLDSVEIAKSKYGDKLQLMVGNVANATAYRDLSNVGADYVRVGIGNGAGCLTTLNTGVGYPMASLIDEVYHMSAIIDRPAKIVADGGMQDYADITKALALGADYVMCGSIFNKALDSAGDTYQEINTRDGRTVREIVDQYSEETQKKFIYGARFYKAFRGMSTKDVQRELGKSSPRTSEGATRERLVEYTLGGWIENFKHYLATAMSYVNAETLNDFIGKPTLVVISDNSMRRVEK